MPIKTAATKGKESKLVPLAVIIAALTGLLISIIAARASFPVYLYYVVVISLLVTIFSLLIYGFLAHPLYNFLKKRREIRKHNTLARKHIDEFKDFTERFDEFIQSRRSDNIPHVLSNLHSQEDFRNISLFPSSVIHNLFFYFQKRLKRFDRTKEDFKLLVEEFDTFLEMYNKFCILDPVGEIRRIGREKVDEQTKENYKKQKVTYERFIGNYTDFGKKLNKEFGENLFRESFETPEEL